MSNKKPQSTEDVFDANAEGSRANGYRPKGRKPPPQGKVVVQHKRAGLGLRLLDKIQLAFISMVSVGAEFMIYDSLVEPYRAHAMWAFGLLALVAAVPCFLRKRE